MVARRKIKRENGDATSDGCPLDSLKRLHKRYLYRDLLIDALYFRDPSDSHGISTMSLPLSLPHCIPLRISTPLPLARTCFSRESGVFRLGSDTWISHDL